jgi:hypothetical protein
VSSTRQILPGQEGHIKVKFNTAGYGGRKIRESVRIQTNDPNRQWLGVAITGMVEKFVEIRPERIILSGPGGQPLFAEVEIIPRKEYPFTIREVEVASGQFIKYEMNKIYAEEQNRYMIRVENTRVEKGRYVDSLNVRTDSDIRPKIHIHIIGIIR